MQTSGGRVRTTVSQHAAFRNADTVSNGGFAQHVQQTDAGWSRSISVGGVGLPLVRLHSWSYPITVDESGQVTDENNFELTGAVDMTRQLGEVDTGAGPSTVTSSTDEVRAQGNDQRKNGVTVQADGSGWQHYVGDDDADGWYDHYLAADHGNVTVDRLCQYPAR